MNKLPIIAIAALLAATAASPVAAGGHHWGGFRGAYGWGNWGNPYLGPYRYACPPSVNIVKIITHPSGLWVGPGFRRFPMQPLRSFRSLRSFQPYQPYHSYGHYPRSPMPYAVVPNGHYGHD